MSSGEDFGQDTDRGGLIRTVPNLRAAAMASDAITLTALWILGAWARSGLRERWTLDLIPTTTPILEDVSFSLHAWLIVILLPAWLWSLARLGTVETLHEPPRLSALLKASALATLLSLGFCFAVHITDFLSRSLVFAFAISTVPALWLSRTALSAAWSRGVLRREPRHIVLVGPPEDAARLIARLEGAQVSLITLTPHPNTARVPVLGHLDQIEAILQGPPIDQVLLTRRDLPATALRQVASGCEIVGVPFSMEANFLDLNLARADLEVVDGVELLTFSSLPRDPTALAAKRAMDLALGAVLLVAMSPIMLLAAVAIWLEDGGPVLFSQERMGRFGRRFTMYKFRSMRHHAESMQAALASENEMDGPVFKMTRDPRVTRVGRFLRNSSIDELPQLYNVICGEMSLVGPRPPLPEEVACYQPWQRRRLSMKPGLTCIWQVSGRSRLDFETWMRLDLEYIDNWSLGLDIQLLLKTIPAVLTGDGAR